MHQQQTVCSSDRRDRRMQLWCLHGAVAGDDPRAPCCPGSRLRRHLSANQLLMVRQQLVACPVLDRRRLVLPDWCLRCYACDRSTLFLLLRQGCSLRGRRTLRAEPSHRPLRDRRRLSLSVLLLPTRHRRSRSMYPLERKWRHLQRRQGVRQRSMLERHLPPLEHGQRQSLLRGDLLDNDFDTDESNPAANEDIRNVCLR